jgi:Xaa-Pro aminopeptidase
MLERLDKLRKALAEKALDGFLVSNLSNCRYLSGFTGSTGWIMVTTKRAGIAVDSRYAEQAKKECPGYEVLPIRGNIQDWFFPLASDFSTTRWGIEPSSLSLYSYQQITEHSAKEHLPFQFISTQNLIESIRAVKDQDELERITQACKLADDAYEHAVASVRAGMTEHQLAWEVERFMREHGSDPLTFEVIVASGPNSAMPHAKPGDRPIAEGEPIILDFGACVGGYCSDFTRTICLGEPQTNLQKIYSVALGSQLTAIETIQAGMTGETADQLARTVIAEAGYGDAFTHGLGHGIGLDVHEAPRVGAKSTDVLTPGMTFTIEPGIYISGWGGVRIEDTVVIENKSVRTLTRSKKSLKA